MSESTVFAKRYGDAMQNWRSADNKTEEYVRKLEAKIELLEEKCATQQQLINAYQMRERILHESCNEDESMEIVL